MKDNFINRSVGETGAHTASTPPPRRLSDAAWDEKWHSMVEHQRQRREQDAILKQKLLEKKEMEEYIECTFTPKTHCNYRSRSQEELLRLMNPLILEEERILQELSNIEASEENDVLSIGQELRTYIATNQRAREEDLIRICERYREERLYQLSRVKNLKLDIVGLLHELERKYNVICVREHLTEEEMSRAGFDIETCRRIKKEILDSVKGVDTLKDRSRVTSEMEDIIKKAKEDAKHHRMYNYQTAVDPMQYAGGIPVAKRIFMSPTRTQMQYPVVGGMHKMVVPMAGGMGVPVRFPPQQVMQEQYVKVPMQQRTKHVAVKQNVQMPIMLPPGAIPPNPNFGYANVLHKNVAPQTVQSSIPRKLQQ
ncbi:hypothetical protein BgAZ_302000 [Babesia gibsoni]|uniref:Uncharacterized protein n=1 Tax=Babesia gibsoni TaxID=33632 RepID=A0AAD8PDT2_BABGI|nr:hypothetical protein BgAZ_302000 [Babesia gibsoni]